MVELSRNARVAVRNPSRVVGYSAPRSIEGRILARGPAGPSGGPIPVGGTAGQVVTPDGFGDYVWTTVEAILGLSGNAVGTSDVQVLTNKDLSSATNTFPSSLATDEELSAHSDATAAHGATGAVVGTTNTQTLTNKTLTDPVITASTGWVAYTPTWTATTTNPSIGDGTLVGYYYKVGRIVNFRIMHKFGSTTSAGSGQYRWSLPVSAKLDIQSAWHALGRAVVQHPSGSPRVTQDAMTVNASTILLADAAAAQASDTSPYTVGSGSTFLIYGSYEAAS